jgi:hypothetical protein
VCTNAASRARDGDPRFAPVAIASGRVTGGFLFHGPRVDGFDLISLESDTYEGAGDRGSLPH